MKVVVVPRSTDLKIVVDPAGDVNMESGFIIPGVYDYWPEARDKGFMEIEIAGDSLRELLAEISNRYHRAGVDLGPICPITNDVKNTYDVYVNEINYVLTSRGLDTKLQKNDEVKIIEDTIGHC